METENQAPVVPLTDSNSAATGMTRFKRTLPSKTLPSDRLAFDKQLSALRAFVVVHESNGGKSVTNEAAGTIINMAASTIVVTNAFFTETRLLQRQKEDQSFIPSPEAIAYHKAYEWDPATAGEKLRPLFEKFWFSEVLVPRLKFRAYDEREALSALAEACQAAKEYEPRLQVLLDYMALAGVIVRDGGMVKAGSGVKGVEKAPEPVNATPTVPAKVTPSVEEGHDSYTLILNAKTKRKVVIQAPHVITTKELERIRAWLGVQLIVEDEAAPV